MAVNWNTGTELRSYNALNQLTSIELGDTIDKSYLYATGKNNGQITQTTDGITGESISYSYDSLKRLSSASATTLPYILNRSFEEISTPNWTLSSNAQLSPVLPHTGSYSIHILSNGGYANPSGDNLPCVAGTTYTISGFYKLDPQEIGYASVLGANGVQLVNLSLTPQSTWTQFSKSYTPTNCSQGQPRNSVWAIRNCQTARGLPARCGSTIYPSPPAGRAIFCRIRDSRPRSPQAGPSAARPAQLRIKRMKAR